MDIETVKIPNVTIQIPALISIAYINNNKHWKNKCFILNKTIFKDKGLDYALNYMWKQVFNYLSKHIKLNNNKSIIFMHNLGSFDGFYIFNGLIRWIDKDNIETIIDKENDFIQISCKYNGVILVWKDSLRIFDVKLNILCETFDVKGKLTDYNKNWNDLEFLFNDNNSILKYNLIKYNLQDSLSLLKTLLKAQQLYWQNYQVDIASIWSTSTLSLKIFRLQFLNETIPSLTQSIDFYVRKGYYGGATDHYKLYGKNLYYYDVNSLYPYAMLKPMPLHHIKYHSDLSMNNINLFFGFCLAEIECPKHIKIPILPFRTINNDVIYPTGIWTGVYFSELLKEAVKHGYKIKLINGHEFSKANIFNNYIHHFYNIKKNSTGSTRFIAKMHLNQLYGYFGRNQELIITKIVNRNELNNLLITRIIKNIIEINDDLFVVLMSDNLNHNLINELNLNLDFSNFKKMDRNVKSNVAIAAAVTAYAQIEMIKYKTLSGYNIYYTDTDSLFIDKPLPIDMVGDELGMMKNELLKDNGIKIDEAYFLGNKKYGYTYFNKDNNKIEMSVFAGARRDTITFNEIKQISKGNIIEKTYDDVFIRSFNKMEISIKERSIKLKISTDKSILNNNYISPYISNINNQFDTSTRGHKIIRKIKSLINKFI